MNIPHRPAYSCQCMPAFITFAGLPTAMLSAGMSLVTMESMPTTEPSSMVTPFITMTDAPNHTWLPMFTSFAQFILVPALSKIECWSLVLMRTPLAKMQSEPISHRVPSAMTMDTSWSKVTLSPICRLLPSPCIYIALVCLNLQPLPTTTLLPLPLKVIRKLSHCTDFGMTTELSPCLLPSTWTL